MCIHTFILICIYLYVYIVNKDIQYAFHILDVKSILHVYFVICLRPIYNLECKSGEMLFRKPILYKTILFLHGEILFFEEDLFSFSSSSYRRKSPSCTIRPLKRG